MNPSTGRYVLAVSGGVDSVVLLDMFATGKFPTTYHLPPTTYQITVAHFDHGIRPDSAADAEFVAELAEKYGVRFETRREELGANASEELARDRRYEFLRSVASKYDAQLVTAHHSDDVIESIAINLSRGTGWRGLAVLDSDILRPLTDMSKSELVDYATKNNLVWHEDSTNASSDYLRNRIRKQLIDFDSDSARQLLGLWQQQKSIKKQIDDEVATLIGGDPQYSRYFFTCIDQTVAIEILRRATSALLTRPQLLNALIAIKVGSSGRAFQAGNGVIINLTSRNFTVELLK